MDRKEAIAYLRDIADNAQIGRYAAALETAIQAMEKLDEIEEWLKKQEAGLLPVPFGTTVFVVEVCRCHAYGAEIKEKWADCANRCTKAVTVIPLGHNRRCMNCAKIFERPFSEKYIGKVGKTVFLTREEAEAALKGEGDESI